ncbi:hypothetical protein OAO94_04630 [Flavobacteriaceae bacterium]|jgi:hypothetical protein|nr:hypothetical protein [Flavobacteriaceae bacterium]MDB4134890.1 hypothetical protein [Flavobacteriaceae bacterium]MDB4180520.1 hypothetical protein [Flavobacteriaceae bacterium]MDB4196589.1 hypothetical protein [Flavobacteriaceae bacterium]MDC0623065.1 hypothetical protein [Flavobacteriaceae bacterium]|tara:strand:- start:795 stop:1019 length:225 start_codon:yes stop_codon:yes gene_type:complete
MDLPKFILGDNTDFPDSIFIIHTEYPRFILNLENDSIKWFENFSDSDEKELLTQTKELIEEASIFYDREVTRYE